jgi:hypothetical protein
MELLFLFPNAQILALTNWKDPPFLKGKSTISMGHFQ